MKPVYKFTAEIRVQLQSYKSSQQQQGYAVNYVRQNSNYVGTFLEWLEKQSLTLQQSGFTEVLDFADWLKQQGHSVNHINKHLSSLRSYFTHLQNEGCPAPVAIGPIRLKGGIRSMAVHGLLEKPELETLYENYTIKDERSHRNKVIIGLLVYQALTREELETLRPENLKLRDGKIQVPATGKLNGRILNLQPFQIIDLQEYVLLIRPKILAERMAERGGRKPDKYQPAKDIHRLFISMHGQEDIKSSLLHLNYTLRKTNPKYKHAIQIRQSVITEWLKEKDLRTVQYMAGHRYVSSTERYQTNNLEDLKEALNKYHPLR